GAQVGGGHGRAELLGTAAGRVRDLDRPPAVLPAHRGALPALRRTSRPRVRGRAAADGTALLHEWDRAEVPPRRSRLTVSTGRRRSRQIAHIPSKPAILAGPRQIHAGCGCGRRAQLPEGAAESLWHGARAGPPRTI